MTAVLIVLVVLLALVLSLAGASVRVLREYERGVVFRFGRLVAQKGPGLVFLMPIADRMVRVTLRTITHTIPPQDVITRDNVPARVDAVAYFRVVDADASVVDIEDYLRATSEIAKTTLALGAWQGGTRHAARRAERLNEDLQRIIDEQTEPWGIKVVTVEIKDVVIPQDMQRAMARQAEAERDRRAKVINAEAEFQAAARLAEAAEVLAGSPAAMQLRYLQTLAEVGKGEGSTVLLPLPSTSSARSWARPHTTAEATATVSCSSTDGACRSVRRSEDAAESATEACRVGRAVAEGARAWRLRAGAPSTTRGGARSTGGAQLAFACCEPAHYRGFAADPPLQTGRYGRGDAAVPRRRVGRLTWPDRHRVV